MSEVGRVSENDCTPFLQNGSAGKSRNYLSAPQATTVPTITRYFQLGEPPEKLGVQDKGWLNNNTILSGLLTGSVITYILLLSPFLLFCAIT